MRPKSGQTINVMLVDDHKCMLWGLEKLIQNEAPRMRLVGTACNRSDAIAGARELHPDVILLDLDLNGDSSLNFLPELRSNDAQVLILTGNRDGATREDAMLRGASGVVLKDQSGDVVIKAIECVYEGQIWLDRVTTGRIFNALANGNASQNVEARKIATLTPKEREIIKGVVSERGAKSHAIAEKLHMSDHTLRNHLTSIYAKLEVKNRVELVMYAIENKLIASTPEIS